MTIEVTIEIPKGQRNKYEVDHETGKVYLVTGMRQRAAGPRSRTNADHNSGNTR